MKLVDMLKLLLLKVCWVFSLKLLSVDFCWLLV